MKMQTPRSLSGHCMQMHFPRHPHAANRRTKLTGIVLSVWKLLENTKENNIALYGKSFK
jgi:hypothetical protein